MSIRVESSFVWLSDALFTHSLVAYSNTIDIWSLGLVFVQIICLMKFTSLVGLLEGVGLNESNLKLRIEAVKPLVGMAMGGMRSLSVSCLFHDLM